MIRRRGQAAILATLAPLLTFAADQAFAQGIGYGKKNPQSPPPQQQGPPPAQEKTFPLGQSWRAVSLNGKPVADRRATLQVDANLRGTGFGGCNTFSAAAYPLRQQGFAVGPLALTKRTCDKAMQDFERTYLTALRGARNWDVVDGKLVVKGAAGELRFDRAL